MPGNLSMGELEQAVADGGIDTVLAALTIPKPSISAWPLHDFAGTNIGIHEHRTHAQRLINF